MKKYAAILCILSIGYILLTNCTKATVAQISFSVSLLSDTAKIQNYVKPGATPPSVRAKYFPLEIKITATQKAVSLYPKAQLYLKYTILDQQGKATENVLYKQVFPKPTNPILLTDYYTPIAPNETQRIAQGLGATTLDKTNYNILRIADTLSTTPYKIVFTLAVYDSAKNESLPVVTPKEAQRTFEVIIDPTNPNKASYKLTYNKNIFYPKTRIENERMNVLGIIKNNYNLCGNDYLKIIG